MQTKHASLTDERPGIKLIFELTNLCNFSCSHCIREEEGAKNFLPVNLVAKVLAEIDAYQSVNFVAFTGGEPTLHPSFKEILSLVTGYGYRFGFVTNGWQFVSRTFPQLQFYREHLGHVTFSLDGAEEETHDTLRRRAGSYRRLLQGISLCRFHNIPVHINMVVTRANRAELEAMALLVGRLGCDALFYGHCQPTPDAVAGGLVLDARERREVEAEVAALQRVVQLPILFAGDHYEDSRFYQCPQLQMREFNIDYRGYLTACCVLSNYRGGTPDTDVIADLNQVSFYEAHERLVAKIAEINIEKIKHLSGREVAEEDRFICTHCLRHYRKASRLNTGLALPVIHFA
jgi:MoaA/NifB/PqqE/SkfB family radical SAM enzyme